MTIATEIARIQGNIEDAYNACAAKGATMPVTNNSASLVNTIDSISGGGDSDEVVGKYMVVNGVAVPQNNSLTNRFDGIIEIKDYTLSGLFVGKNNFNTGVAFPDLVTVGNYAMMNCFRYCQNITSALFPNVAYVGTNSFNSCFSNCPKINIVDFSNLHHVNGVNAMVYAFANSGVSSNNVFPNLEDVSNVEAMQSCFLNCQNLTSFTFPSLTLGRGMAGMFTSCKNLTDLSFPSLINVVTMGFSGLCRDCSNLVNVSFPNLTTLLSESLDQTFWNCTSLKTLSFPSLTNVLTQGSYTPFPYMLYGCTDVTVHFPAAMQSVIGSWSVVLGGFSGTNTTVLFDL